MSLLPDVERELLRAARRPLPAGIGADRVLGSKPEERISRARRNVAAAAALVFALMAVALGGIFLVALHHGGAIRPSGHRQAPSGTFPGAPMTQRGDWAGGGNVCPLASRSRYLPARSGCVTVLRADVEGNGRLDLVLLYERLSHRRVGDLYVPTSFVLKVVRASGGVVQTRIPVPEAAPTIVEVGHINAEPGVALFILVTRISSGSSVDVYTFDAGRLVGAGRMFGYGGDSGLRAGFTCRAGHPPAIVQHSFVLEGPGESGWWQRTDITYAWHGATLRQVARRSSMRRGIPPLSATGLGVGCGTVNQVASLKSPDANVHPTRAHPTGRSMLSSRSQSLGIGSTSIRSPARRPTGPGSVSSSRTRARAT